MANPLEGLMGMVEKVPPMVWIVGGIGVVGFVGYRAMSGARSSGSGQGATQATVAPIAGQPTDLASVVSELGNNESNALAIVAAQASQQQGAIVSAIQTQQQQDALASQGFESLILGGLNQQEQNYQSLQGQTEQYLAQNQQSFSQAQGSMAQSLADLWAKLASIQQAPAVAPVSTDPTADQIAQNAKGLDIPVFDIQAFSGAYHHLPGSIPELDNFLNSVGLRDPNSGKLLMPH